MDVVNRRSVAAALVQKIEAARSDAAQAYRASFVPMEADTLASFEFEYGDKGLLAEAREEMIEEWEASNPDLAHRVGKQMANLDLECTEVIQEFDCNPNPNPSPSQTTTLS